MQEDKRKKQRKINEKRKPINRISSIRRPPAFQLKSCYKNWLHKYPISMFINFSLQNCFHPVTFLVSMFLGIERIEAQKVIVKSNVKRKQKTLLYPSFDRKYFIVLRFLSISCIFIFPISICQGFHSCPLTFLASFMLRITLNDASKKVLIDVIHIFWESIIRLLNKLSCFWSKSRCRRRKNEHSMTCQN